MPLRWISQGLAPLTLLAAAAAFLYPPLFLVFENVFLWFFALTMAALGIVLEPDELRLTLRGPKAIGLGVLTQYSVMPAAGFVAAWVSGLPPALALGFIIVGCAPGAMASNVIVFLAGGAVAYSVALTTVATFLSPLLTPLLVDFLGGVFVPIPFRPMMRTIVLTVVLPLLAGMALRRLLSPRGLRMALLWSPAVAVSAIVVICGYAVAANQDHLSRAGWPVLLLVILVNFFGYATGWLLGGIYRFDRAHRLTLSLEVGMQNAGLGVVLALRHFSPETALPGVIYAVWCIITASAATLHLRRRAADSQPRTGEPPWPRAATGQTASSRSFRKQKIRS